MDILCSFRLVLERKTGKEIPKSSRFEFLEKLKIENSADSYLCFRLVLLRLALLALLYFLVMFKIFEFLNICKRVKRCSTMQGGRDDVFGFEAKDIQ